MRVLQNTECNGLMVWASWEWLVPPVEGQVWSCLLQHIWNCCINWHHLQFCAAWPQQWVWDCLGGLWWFYAGLWPLLCCSSHECLMDVAAPGWVAFTTEPVCVKQGGCSLPLSHSQNLSSPPSNPARADSYPSLVQLSLHLSLDLDNSATFTFAKFPSGGF